MIEVSLPPLRDRPEDIPELAQHFIRRYAGELGKRVTELTPEALAQLEAYAFPGNVRELENLIERAVTLAAGTRITEESLPSYLIERPAGARKDEFPSDGANLDQILAAVESGYLREALKRSGGVKKEAARLLGISFRSFRYRLEKLGFDGSHESDE